MKALSQTFSTNWQLITAAVDQRQAQRVWCGEVLRTFCLLKKEFEKKKKKDC